jgi:hypothetical protein
MKKTLITLSFIIGILTISKGQMTIEEQVADTVCACLNSVNENQIKANRNVIKMQCLSDGVAKNLTAIQKNYSTEKRREEDAEKMGVQGSLYINVQKELKKNCPVYVLFESKVHSYRSAGRAGLSMEKKNVK